MVDWKSLFEASKGLYNGNDGSALNIVPVTQEDVALIMKKTESYTFEAQDRLKQILDDLKMKSEEAQERLKSGEFVADTDEVLELFEEFTELLELNKQSNISVCRMGGLPTVLQLMIVHESPEVRKFSARAFNTICGNNQEAQEYALRAGAVNLSA